MRLFCQIFFWVYILSCICRVIYLSMNEYPRSRGAISPAVDVTALIFEAAIVLWLYHLIWQT